MQHLLKPWFLLTALSLGLLVMGFSLGERQGLLVGFALVLLLNGTVYFYTDIRISNMMGGHELVGQDAWQLEETVSKLAHQARIPKPRLVILALSLPTTLSTGRNWQRGTIYISEGLLKILSPDELRAVLAYEVARIKRLDTLVTGIGSSLSSALLAGPRWMDMIIFNPLFSRYGLKSPVQHLVGWMAAAPIRLILGRSNYYAADQMAARLIGQPQSLAHALWKLQSFAGAETLDIPASNSLLFVVNPMPHRHYEKHFNVHPPVEKRIEKLVGYFPI